VAGFSFPRHRLPTFLLASIGARAATASHHLPPPLPSSQEHGPRLIRQRFMDSAEADAVIKISVDAMLQ
jgi:hypothetical protein